MADLDQTNTALLWMSAGWRDVIKKHFVDPKVVKVIAETTWNVAQREYRKQIISIIEDLASLASADTGYGKAQRAFAVRILAALGKRTASETTKVARKLSI